MFCNINVRWFGGCKCYRRQIQHETCGHVGLSMKGCKVNRASERAKGQRKENTQRDHEKQMSGNVTSLPASMVSLSLFPSSEPEATMALSMSPVARWQTQYCSARRGACREEEAAEIIYVVRATDQMTFNCEVHFTSLLTSS